MGDVGVDLPVDMTVDVVIVGSGGGGMVAALAAADAGAEALVLEKQALVGGSTCMSGGIFWIPANPLLNDPKWGALYLWKGGEPTEHAARCPETMRALQAAPVPHIRSRSPMK